MTGTSLIPVSICPLGVEGDIGVLAGTEPLMQYVSQDLH